MAGATRGFLGRARKVDPRLPPGQYDVGDDFPVLTAEVTPRIAPERWSIAVDGLVSTPSTWSWDQAHRLPASVYEGDIHCVTTWSKLGTSFGGVSVDTLLDAAGPLPQASFVMARSSTGYTTNLPLADVTDDRPPPVLLEERQVDQPDHPDGPRRARFLGTQRVPRSRRSMAATEVPG